MGFKVFFELSKPHEGCIDEWLKYALAMKVQTLELDFYKVGWGSRSPPGEEEEELYSFPHRFLNHSEQLKKISLAFVNVNGEALVFFLRNCPLLEDLSVSHSRDLLTLRISGPFPSLKRLEISLCHNLNLVGIRDVNLVHLKYRGKEDTEGFYSTVKMSNLMQLVVTYLVLDVDSLLPLTNAIRAAPCLEKFVLKTRLFGKFCKRKIRKMKNVYSHLKEVEFVGYCGVTCELELIMHFVENAAALEKIIIDPRKFYRSPLTRKLSRNSFNSTKRE